MTTRIENPCILDNYVQSKTKILGQLCIGFIFVLGSGIAMVFTLGNNTYIILIYSQPVNQAAILISFLGIYRIAPRRFRGISLILYYDFNYLRKVEGFFISQT